MVPSMRRLVYGFLGSLHPSPNRSGTNYANVASSGNTKNTE